MNKMLFIICGVLLVVFGLVFIKSQNINKIINGANTEIPQNNYDIVKPPVIKDGSKAPQINVGSAILIDVPSFKIMYAINSDRKVSIASTTKIMSALVVLEEYPDKLNETVTITKDMVNVEGSDIQLKAGEKITVVNLMKGLLIMSGNDTAYSLADYFEGRNEFVKKMNEKAKHLGIYNTEFKDPAGLNDEGYSTASDLAVMATYAMRNKQFADIVKSPKATITSVDGKFMHELKNSNRLILPEEQLYYPPAIGIKTGFTNEAGHCLVSEAVNNNHQILSVILNTDENTLTASAKESKKLLEWGLNNWEW